MGGGGAGGVASRSVAGHSGGCDVEGGVRTTAAAGACAGATAAIALFSHKTAVGGIYLSPL